MFFVLVEAEGMLTETGTLHCSAAPQKKKQLNQQEPDRRSDSLSGFILFAARRPNNNLFMQHVHLSYHTTKGLLTFCSRLLASEMTTVTPSGEREKAPQKQNVSFFFVCLFV